MWVENEPMDELKQAPRSATPLAVGDLNDLHAWLRDLFGSVRLSFSDFGAHQTMFFVPGTVRAVQATLAMRTDPALWSGEGRLLTHCNDDVGNWCLSLSRGGPGLVLVFSTVLSLHRQYLARVRTEVAEPVGRTARSVEAELHAH